MNADLSYNTGMSENVDIPTIIQEKKIINEKKENE